MTCKEESCASDFTNNGTVSQCLPIYYMLYVFGVYQVPCSKINKRKWPVVKGFWMNLIELRKFHHFTKQTGIQQFYNVLTLLSCDERKRKFAISKLYMDIVTASQKLIAYTSISKDLHLLQFSKHDAGSKLQYLSSGHNHFNLQSDAVNVRKAQVYELHLHILLLTTRVLQRSIKLSQYTANMCLFPFRWFSFWGIWL